MKWHIFKKYKWYTELHSFFKYSCKVAQIFLLIKGGISCGAETWTVSVLLQLNEARPSSLPLQPLDPKNWVAQTQGLVVFPGMHRAHFMGVTTMPVFPILRNFHKISNYNNFLSLFDPSLPIHLHVDVREMVQGGQKETFQVN